MPGAEQTKAKLEQNKYGYQSRFCIWSTWYLLFAQSEARVIVFNDVNKQKLYQELKQNEEKMFLFQILLLVFRKVLKLH